MECRPLKYKKKSVAVQIRAIEEGLPFADFESVRCALDLPQSKLAELVGMGRSTLARRKKTGRLSKIESERIDRIARIIHRAKEVFEDSDIAKRWLNEPLNYFQGKSPLQYTVTEIGGREVESLLGRMEHGVFS